MIQIQIWLAFMQLKQQMFNKYSQTCIKRSLLGQSKSGLLKQVHV
jgi:hypothetical protein